MAEDRAWPDLPLLAWRETCDTLHMFAQVVGKVRLALAYPEPEWAHVALYVTPRGLTTGPIPFADRAFQIDFDFDAHRLRVGTSDAETREIALAGTSVSEFYRELMAVLKSLHIDVRIWPMPVEIPSPVRFSDDTAHASYDAEYVGRFKHVLLHVDAALREHRAPFRRRHTPVQFFWGSFDLAYARFSGRPATPPSNDIIMKNAMDAEEICAGFWPGDDRFKEPAFWCYAYPRPAGIEDVDLHVPGARWDSQMGEFILPYEAVRTAKSPREVLRQFFGSAYASCSSLAKWDDIT
ncbi:MAG TPA: DUF5996 family protein [Candidatus Baltobacteraceae bacterium]|jgi:hypothetical protein|nr:DUF5996 family protein [Candidatus Baltobacteraceae bacterium]